MSTPSLSVVVCTLNRRESLAVTLEVLCQARASAAWEIIVVDNGSTDRTREVVAEAAASSPVPIRYEHEPRNGLSCARNRGIAGARGDVVAFTDDDVSVAPDWVARLLLLFARPEVQAAGGKILPAAPHAMPAWLTPELYPFVALLDLGDQERRLHTADIWGANLAVRRACFDRHGGFDPTLGRTADRLYADEETDFLKRLIAAGDVVLYDPALVVHHRLSAQRLTRRHMRRCMLDRGEQERHRQPGPTPPWAYSALLQAGWRLVLSRAGLRRQTAVQDWRFYWRLGFVLAPARRRLGFVLAPARRRLGLVLAPARRRLGAMLGRR